MCSKPIYQYKPEVPQPSRTGVQGCYVCMSALEQKFPQCKQTYHLETDSDSQVEHHGKESEYGGAGLGTHLHCQEFQQEPNLGHPPSWQHQPWEESGSWAHPIGKQHSRQHYGRQDLDEG